MGNATIFSVPLEIRNQIYCYVYACDIVYPTTKKNGLRCLYMDIKPFPGGGFHRELSPSASEVLALLLVNRQMLEEAAAIFYRRNQFLGNAFEMSRFIKGIGRTRANLLTNLVFSHTEELILEHDLLKCLLPLQGLKMVHLNSWDKNFDGLKDSLVRAGILDLTGKFNIEVSNVWFKHEAGDRARYQKISHVWSCEKGASEWKGPKKTVTCIHY